MFNVVLQVVLIGRFSGFSTGSATGLEQMLDGGHNCAITAGGGSLSLQLGWACSHLCTGKTATKILGGDTPKIAAPNVELGGLK